MDLGCDFLHSRFRFFGRRSQRAEWATSSINASAAREPWLLRWGLWDVWCWNGSFRDLLGGLEWVPRDMCVWTGGWEIRLSVDTAIVLSPVGRDGDRMTRPSWIPPERLCLGRLEGWMRRIAFVFVWRFESEQTLHDRWMLSERSWSAKIKQSSVNAKLPQAGVAGDPAIRVPHCGGFTGSHTDPRNKPFQCSPSTSTVATARKAPLKKPLNHSNGQGNRKRACCSDTSTERLPDLPIFPLWSHSSSLQKKKKKDQVRVVF
jgi:hypothetical protein